MSSFLVLFFGIIQFFIENPHILFVIWSIYDVKYMKSISDDIAKRFLLKQGLSGWKIRNENNFSLECFTVLYFHFELPEARLIFLCSMIITGTLGSLNLIARRFIYSELHGQEETRGFWFLPFPLSSFFSFSLWRWIRSGSPNDYSSRTRGNSFLEEENEDRSRQVLYKAMACVCVSLSCSPFPLLSLLLCSLSLSADFVATSDDFTERALIWDTQLPARCLLLGLFFFLTISLCYKCTPVCSI